MSVNFIETQVLFYQNHQSVIYYAAKYKKVTLTLIYCIDI